MKVVESPPRKLARPKIALVVVGIVLLLLLVGALIGRAEPDGAGASAGLAQTSFLALAVLSLLAGILSFASPCTLPLLPAYFAITFQSDQRRVLVMTIAFVGGLALTFALFGALAGFVGQVLNAVGLSRFELARIGGVVILAFGLMSLLGRGFAGIQSRTRADASLWGSFVFGATFGLGWTACVGPVLGAITTLAINANIGVMAGQLGQLAPVVGSTLLLVIFAMGLGMPLILVSTLFRRADRNGVFWRLLRGKGWEVTLLGRTFQIHSTTALSGIIFVALGILMISGRLTLLNSLVPDDLALSVAELLSRIEDWLFVRLGR